MRILIFLLTFIYSTNSFSAVEIRLEFDVDKVRQGWPTKGRMIINSNDLEFFRPGQLVGETLGETLYFTEVSPPIKVSDEELVRSEVSVIFLKIPENKFLSVKQDEVDILISFSEVKIIPTPAEKNFIFERFNILTDNHPFFLIILALMILALFLIPLFFWTRKRRRIKQIKAFKDNLLAEMRGAHSFEEIIIIWQKKNLLFEHLPEIVPSFTRFEKVLFLYQFKKYQTDEEKDEVTKAYEKFLNAIEGGPNGV